MIKLLLNAGIPETRGGIFTCLKTIIKYLNKECYEISLVYYSDQVLADYEQAFYNLNPGLTIYRLPSFSIKNLTTGRFFNAVQHLFAQYKFDILHSHDTFASAYLFKQAKKNNIPLRIMHSHNTKYSNTIPKSLRNKFLYTLTENAVTHGISCSHGADDFLFKNKPSTVIYNGIDCDKFEFNQSYRHEIRQYYKISNETIVLGNVAAIQPVKNQIFLINLMKKLRKSNCKLILVGSGEDFDFIQQEIIDNQLEDNILLLGQREDTHKLLSAMDIFLFPSLFEGFGISLLEAQVNGLRSLASNCIPDEVGITDLVEFLPIDKEISQEIWVEKIHNYTEVTNRKEYREIVENLGFSSKKFIENLENAYARLMLETKEKL